MFCQISAQMFRNYLRPSATLFRTIRRTVGWDNWSLSPGRTLGSGRSSTAVWRGSHASSACTGVTCVRTMSSVKNKDCQMSAGAGNNVHVARVMLPDDGNPLSVVHGGVVLQIIEQAGFICSTKYCNDVPEKDHPDYKAVVCALVRVERMMFHHSISIGDFVEAEAEVTYTAPHSLSVAVKVFAQNILKGHRRLTNQATLWYVPVQVADLTRVQAVPPMSHPTPQAQAQGLKAYQRQKHDREDVVLDSTEITHTGGERHTVGHSQTSMAHLILHSHCGPLDYCLGGSALKWMDECAGITAAKHCLSLVVTLSLDATNFMKMSKLGDVLAITSRVVFSSEKTLEVECLVDLLRPFHGSEQRERSIEAYFTFVSIDQSRRPLPMVPLKITDRNEELRFQRRQQKYLQRVQDRQESKKMGKS